MINHDQTAPPTIMPVNEGPDINTLQHADVPAIWEDFRTKLTQLKTTAETLTVTNASQTTEMALARSTRLNLKSLRVEIENKRKDLGEEALRRKQRIDSAAKELRDVIEPLEQRLLVQEQFVERQEEKRKSDLRDRRSAELQPFVVDTSLYNLADMPEPAYVELLAGSKAAHVAKVERERQEREVREAKEKEEAAERERIRIENDRLRREAAGREQALATERRAREKAERELAEKAKRERKDAEAKALAARKAAAAPDKKKLEQLAITIRQTPVPDMDNTKVRKIVSEAFGKFATWIEQQAETL